MIKQEGEWKYQKKKTISSSFVSTDDPTDRLAKKVLKYKVFKDLKQIKNLSTRYSIGK
jgi:hypothetical protein